MIISYENNDSLTIFILIPKTPFFYMLVRNFYFTLIRAFNCIPLGALLPKRELPPPKLFPS